MFRLPEAVLTSQCCCAGGITAELARFYLLSTPCKAMLPARLPPTLQPLFQHLFPVLEMVHCPGAWHCRQRRRSLTKRCVGHHVITLVQCRTAAVGSTTQMCPRHYLCERVFHRLHQPHHCWCLAGQLWLREPMGASARRTICTRRNLRRQSGWRPLPRIMRRHRQALKGWGRIVSCKAAAQSLVVVVVSASQQHTV